MLYVLKVGAYLEDRRRVMVSDVMGRHAPLPSDKPVQVWLRVNSNIDFTSTHNGRGLGSKRV